jgi:hypothetical protein
MAATYTTVDKVGNALDFPNGYFTVSSTPTTTVVTEFIEEAESEIEDLTGHAWKEITVLKEYVEPSSVYSYGTGVRFKLIHRTIRSIDKLEVFDGSTWVDWKVSKTEGRNADWWYDEVSGVVFLIGIYRLLPHSVRVDYKYGESAVPKSIQRATSLITAMMILNAPEFSVVNFTQSDGTRPSWSSTKETWQKEIDKIIETRKEFQ